MVKNSDGCNAEHDCDEWEEQALVVEAFGVDNQLVDEIDEVVDGDKGADHLQDFEPLRDDVTPQKDFVFAL